MIGSSSRIIGKRRLLYFFVGELPVIDVHYN